MYRILSLDGGGLRGVLTARLLEHLEKKVPYLGRTNLLAGTSTGAILAAGLASGLNPGQLINFYKEEGPKIFKDSLLDNLHDIGSMVGAKYSTEPRKKALQGVFNDKVLGDLNKSVLIATFDLDSSDDPFKNGAKKAQGTWKAKFFHNFETAATSDNDRTVKVVDALMASSAAPVYFPIYEGYIDGGMVANNPSTCALAEALNKNTGKQAEKDIVLLSVGTGNSPRSVPSMNGDWGLLQWGLTLIYILFEGSSGLADYQCQQVLCARYCRINVDLPHGIGLDDVKAIPELLQLADNHASKPEFAEAVCWVNDNWK